MPSDEALDTVELLKFVVQYAQRMIRAGVCGIPLQNAVCHSVHVEAKPGSVGVPERAIVGVPLPGMPVMPTGSEPPTSVQVYPVLVPPLALMMPL